MNARVPQQVGTGGSRHPLRAQQETGGSGTAAQPFVQQSITSRNPIPSGRAHAWLGTRSHRAAPDASPFGSCGSDPADGSRPRVLPAHVRSRSRAGRGRALGQRPHAATAAHTADRAERPPAGQHPDDPTGSPAGRSLRTTRRASSHTPPTRTPQQDPVVAARGPAARRPACRYRTAGQQLPKRGGALGEKPDGGRRSPAGRQPSRRHRVTSGRRSSKAPLAPVRILGSSLL